MTSDKTHWGKLYGSLCLHPKWLSTPAEGRALWTSALSYCIVIGSDGEVPEGVLHMLSAPGASVEASVDQLLNSGLWRKSDKGYSFHDWSEFQQTVDERKSLRAKRAEAGKASAEARRKARSEPDNNAGSASVEAPVEQTLNIEATEKRREEKRRVKDSAPSGYTEEFETFWKSYPRKKEKADAFKAWKTAMKRTTAEEAAAAVKIYARDMRGKEPEYIKLGATWLNKQCWEDYTVTTITRDNGQQIPEWSKTECDEILGGSDHWVPPSPPAGLDLMEERAWKQARAAEHLDERRQKAWEVVNRDNG